VANRADHRLERQGDCLLDSGQANAIGQAGGGPVLGVLGNVRGIRSALAAGALAIAPALGFYGRAITHSGREPGLAEAPAAAVVD